MNMEARLAAIPALFPEALRPPVTMLLEERGDRLEELRLRSGRGMGYVIGGRELLLQWQGSSLRVEQTQLEEILRRASGNAVYAVQEQLCRGFLSLPCGHRLGVCGLAGTERGRLSSIREPQALNLRLAQAIPGCADRLAALLWADPGSTLIAGPPGSGKTTLLRDMVRQLSDRFGRRVAVIDERGELAACRGGTPQLDVGAHTDVLSGCPKEKGIPLTVRTMAPEWLAVDEITAAADAEALAEAACCGVRFLATVHAASQEELQQRPVYRKLFAAGIFEHIAVIGSDRGIRWERIKRGIAQAGRDRDGPGVYLVGRPACGAAAAPDP